MIENNDKLKNVLESIDSDIDEIERTYRQTEITDERVIRASICGIRRKIRIKMDNILKYSKK